MKAWILLSTLILLITGCTSVTYVNTDATDANFEDDNAECIQLILKTSIETKLAQAEESESLENASTVPTTNASLRQKIEQCLQSKGGRLETDVN